MLGSGQFLVGVAIMGVASAVYIGARLGAGPRDGFVLGLSRRSGWSIRGTRIRVELVVLGLALLIGGSIGLGTLLFAFLMGPSMQAAFKVFRPRLRCSECRRTRRRRSPSTRQEWTRQEWRRLLPWQRVRTNGGADSAAHLDSPRPLDHDEATIESAGGPYGSRCESGAAPPL